MDRDTTRKIVRLLSDNDRDMLHHAIQDTLHAKPKQHCLLSMDWEYAKGMVCHKTGGSVSTDLFRRQIAALPDCLRALKAVSDKITWMDTAYYGGSDIVKLVDAALKKAGIG